MPVVFTSVRSLAEAWRCGVDQSPASPALCVDGTTFSYTVLDERARSMAAVIAHTDPTGAPVAVLAQRSAAAYISVLAAVLAGRTYVPLHPAFPADRTAAMLQRSGAATLAVGAEADGVAPAVLAPSPDTPALLFATRAAPDWASTTNCTVVGDADTTSPAIEAPVAVGPDSIAYLLFTSGSTGQPKGVGVTQANVAAYLSYVVDAFGYSPDDRCSQMFDLTFDLSVHDLFVTWMAGACLCVPSKRATVAPVKFLRDERITTWFSVPATAMVMGRMRMLAPGAYPDLRLSLFCGEALPTDVAAKWASAAPNSAVHNLYGPTEATIAITSYELTATSPTSGLVPIGKPFADHEIAVIDADGDHVVDGERGELCLAGPQVTPGYWDQPDRTEASFVRLPDSDSRWYRTGDLVDWSEPDGLRFHGRVDDQVQIMGYRVELVEVDGAVRAALGTDLAVTLAHPAGPAAEALFAFASRADECTSESSALARCREQLPPYMVPKRVFFIDQMPLNSNGKIDRGRLRTTLDGLLDD